MQLFYGHFATFFRRIMCFKLLFILIFSIYAWVWLYDVFYWILGHFDPTFDPHQMYFDLFNGNPCDAMPAEQEKS